MNAANWAIFIAVIWRQVVAKLDNSPNSDKPNNSGYPTILARLTKKTTTQPFKVITKVFDQAPLSNLNDYLLPNWLRVVVINTQSPYSYGNGHELLWEFYERYSVFNAIVSCFGQQATDQSFKRCYQLLSSMPIDYQRRELADFLETGVDHDSKYSNGFSPWQALMTYSHVLTW